MGSMAPKAVKWPQNRIKTKLRKCEKESGISGRSLALPRATKSFYATSIMEEPTS